ncbi:MAG TPA: PDZ domain-containing protein [Candidatus Hydrogenedens sp.]|nr:PDZ domain-containing protein [Candidatus Hydrogenedens sp.]
MKVLLRIIFLCCVLSLQQISQGYGEEETLSPEIESLPKHVQETIVQVVDKLQPALVRIHVVEKYYREGRELKQEKYGSGVVITADGYVVTNHHVAGKAFFADCTFSNLRNYPIKLIGTDALSDISVLKIITDEPENFVYLSFGDSDSIKVGDYVLAMGSPMALSPSVTLGIISNKQMIPPYKLESFEIFSGENENVGSLVYWLGHNAEISPGSSGGPLINLQGEIIGINEIKYALGGAIPSNLAKKVVNDIIQTGKVIRSWVGLEIQPLTDKDSSRQGALVRYVYPNSPSDKAGIKTGDILTEIDNIPINVKYMEQVPLVNNIFCSLSTDKPVNFNLTRNTDEIDVLVQPVSYDYPNLEEKELKAWGCTVKNLNWLLALNKNRDDVKGVLITSIRIGGSAAQAKPSLQSGDIIVQVENEPISSLDDLENKTKTYMEEQKEKLLVVVERDRNKIYSMIKIGNPRTNEPIREASKPWIGVDVQVLTREIAEKIGVEEGGFIITRIYPVKAEGVQDLKVGDVVKEIENEKFHASRVEEYEEWKEWVRSFSIDQKINLSIIRNGEMKQIPVQLIKEPIPRNMVEKYQDEWLEFTVRELCFYDYVDMNLKEDVKGVYIEQVISGGWASLAKLEQGDIILSLQNEPIENLNAFKERLAKIKSDELNKFVFQIQRGVQKYFVQIEVR